MNGIKFVLLLVFLAFQSQAQQAVGRVVDGTIFPGITTDLQNFIKNPSARINAAHGTATSSATLVRDTDTADKLDGVASFLCDSSAQNGYCEFDTYTIPEGYKTGNCMGAFQYKGDASLYRLQVTDGTNVISQGTYPLGNVTDWTWAVLNYPCGSTRKVRLTQTETGTGAAVNVGQVTWSRATNLSQTAQTRWWGRTSIGPVTGVTCAMTATTSLAFADLGTDADCTINNFGHATTTTKTFYAMFPSLPAGDFWVTADAAPSSGGAANTFCTYRLSDGTEHGPAKNTQHIDNQEAQGITLNHKFSYPSGSTSAVTFRVQGYRLSGTGSCDIYGTDEAPTINVWYFPNMQSTVYAPEIRNWRIDAEIGGALIGLNTSDTGYNTPANASLTLTNLGPTNGNITCSGTNPPGTTSCPAGSEETGINFDITEAQRVKVCAQFGEEVDANSASALYSNWRWEETASNSQTLIQSCGPQITVGFDGAGAARDDNIYPHTICGECSFATNGNKTLRLKNAVGASGTINAHQIHASTTDGVTGKVRITVEPVNVNVPAPVLFGGSEWLVHSTITGGQTSLGTTATASFAGIENSAWTLTNHANALVAQIPCSSTNASTGTTCSVGNESLGAVWSLPNKGWVEICPWYSHSIDGNSAQGLAAKFKIVETPNNAQTILQEGFPITYNGPSSSSWTYNRSQTLNQCSAMYFASAGQKTVRVFFDNDGAGTASTNSINCDGGADTRNCGITIKPLSQAPANSVSNGDYVETKSASSVSFGASNVVSDLTSLLIPAGDWDCTGIGVMSATASVTDLRYGISTTSGNSTTGLVNGDNYFFDYSGSSTYNKTFIIPNYRVVLPTATTHYFKIRSTYGGSTPAVESHKLSCRKWKNF